MRRKPNLEMRVDNCAHLLVSDPKSLKGRWRSEFKQEKLHIELGCGKGSFTVETAKTEPGVMHIALEKLTNILVLALELANREGAQNVRFINALADDLTEFFAPDEADRIYLNFCDPWPARTHAKRRLTSTRFLKLYGSVLRLDGEIHLKTDNLPFFEFSLRELESCGFLIIEETRDLHKNGQVGIMTDYELKFFNQGLPIYKCIARSVGDAALGVPRERFSHEIS